MHRDQGYTEQLPTAKGCLVQNVNSAKAEKSSVYTIVKTHQNELLSFTHFTEC